MIRLVSKIVLGAVVALALMLGETTPSGNVQACDRGPCLCPQIYAPVKCSNGKTYPNQCEADCARAKNCVPTGDI